MSLTHLVTISVGVSNPENHATIHDMLSRLGTELSVDAEYVSVSSATTDDTDEDVLEQETHGCLEEHLYHDDNTMNKVREILSLHLQTFGYHPQGFGIIELRNIITGMINDLQNAGILFRERS